MRDCWPDLVAIDGKTSRRSHDLASGTLLLHLVSTFATTSRLVLAREAVPHKADELSAIPASLDRLAADGGLGDALVSIDAGVDHLLTVKTDQPDHVARANRPAPIARESCVAQTRQPRDAPRDGQMAPNQPRQILATTTR